MSGRSWLKFGIGLLSLAAVVALYGLIAPHVLPLPVYMNLPDVTLVDQNGHPFALSSTRGRVVVLSPIYTHCPDVCPLTISKMKGIEKRLRRAGLDRQVRLLTFTVDPERDDVQVLRGLSSSVEADSNDWTFLTGPRADVERLISAMGIYAAPTRIDGTPVPDSALAGLIASGTPYLVNHTDRLFLTDRRGRVRALSPGSEANVDQVVHTVQKLIAGS